MTFDELSESVYEDLNGHIVSVSSEAQAYRVAFECDDWHDHDRRRRFNLIFKDVAECTATPSSCGELQAFDEHPLLWQHNDEQVTMFFSSASSEPFALLGRLYEAHERFLGGWRSFSDYWHADSKLLRLGHGQLASGPRRVIDEYSQIVGDTLRHSIVHARKPAGGYRVVLFDECYVVCRNISVIEQELCG